MLNRSSLFISIFQVLQTKPISLFGIFGCHEIKLMEKNPELSRSQTLYYSSEQVVQNMLVPSTSAGHWFDSVSLLFVVTVKAYLDKLTSVPWTFANGLHPKAVNKSCKTKLLSPFSNSQQPLHSTVSQELVILPVRSPEERFKFGRSSFSNESKNRPSVTWTCSFIRIFSASIAAAAPREGPLPQGAFPLLLEHSPFSDFCCEFQVQTAL